MNPAEKVRTVRRNSTHDKLRRWVEFLDLPTVSFTNCAWVFGQIRMADVDFGSLDRMCYGYDRVVALGGFASKALLKIGVDHFKAPHPSPRNRKFNEPGFELAMLKELKEYLDE